MQARHDTDLDRQGFLLVAFDLLVAAIVIWFVGEMLTWNVPGLPASARTIPGRRRAAQNGCAS